MRRDDAQPLSELIEIFIKKNHLEKGFHKVKVEKAWEELMGKNMMAYTQSVSLREDTLYVTLHSSVMRQELSYHKDKLLHALNEKLGKAVITRIILK